MNLRPFKPLAAAASSGSSLDLAPPPAQVIQIERSRRRILEAIGEEQDVTFVRGLGNLGDELIWAGTRQLLSAVPHREIGVEHLANHSGELAVLTGGGAWCHPFHEFMPTALEISQRNFSRVIVLPSSFDTSVPEVRIALSRSSALVFAREEESFNQINELCSAEMALDCAFFFDFAPYRITGKSTLDVFRTDQESSRLFEVPSSNVDISVTCNTLEEWLHSIASHELIRTDRAHVMIAAAMMGKRVEFLPSSYHKLPAIAAFALREFAVRQIAPRSVIRSWSISEAVSRVRTHLEQMVADTKAITFPANPK